ncbi:HutD/Ves family protein [Vreelandella olivaria]|uniref:HutD/Ves family protein n=1 Tax=Vreelandella olivaria TaxID=390919 RepID=UPI00201F7A7B|nr:HutD family protein [Halomonas olivaria]
MSLPTTLRFAELNPVAWRNGGGITRVVACQVGAEPPGWRISIAELDKAGPFSVIPEVTRHFTVIGDQPVTLLFSKQCAVLAPHESVTFDGETAVSCLLPNGPSRALNVMYQPQNWQARVTWLVAGEPFMRNLHADTLLFAIGGRAWMTDHLSHPSSLPLHNAALHIASGDAWYWPGASLSNASEAPIMLAITPHARLCKVELQPRA